VSVSMTLGDLERRDARDQIFTRISLITLAPFAEERTFETVGVNEINNNKYTKYNITGLYRFWQHICTNVTIGRTKRRRLAMAGSHRYICFAVLGVTLLVGHHSNVKYRCKLVNTV